MKAPGVERFARRHEDDLAVIGLGTRDSVEDARAFVAEYGPRSIPMVWDASRRSREQLKIPYQPAAVLFDARGRVLKRWFGRFDEEEVVALARGER